MSVRVEVKWDKSQIAALQTGPLKAALRRALSKAGATALRDMRAEATKRVLALKRLKKKYITRALTLSKRGGDISNLAWALLVSGQPVPLIAYPHRVKARGRQFKRKQGPRAPGGVIVEVNPGKQTLIRGAFVATMKSGHQGIFKRRGTARLPIEELLGSRPVDALLHSGQADGVAARGGQSFAATFERVLPMEIGKSKGG